ncbi:MAG: hypothetical protein MUC28_02585 [Planctomycetes bacterium]|jgi:hypothetical protein|nr:hypothetical protein [Planctomycetota bacterium]
MKKQKHNRKKIIILIVVLVALYGFLPPLPQANAIDSIKDASDTISDSDLGQTATHTVDFTTTNLVGAGGYIEVAFESTDWGTITADGNITCPGGGVASRQDGNRTARCTYAGGLATGTLQLVIANVVNPATSSTYYLGVTNRDSGDVIRERVTVAVRIIDDVLMTARVDSTLVFNIFGTSTSAHVGGVPCSNTSTATTTPFGTLIVGATSTVCQMLEVTTNADDGFIVTVEQDGELLSDSGSNINSFNNSQDGTGSTTPAAWAVPRNELDNYHTYGHMGLFTDDADVEDDGGGDFDNGETGAVWFAGLNSTDPLIVFAHDGPSDGETQSIGHTNVLYQAEIGSLQEAGDYESTLTYICTPTY